MTLTDVLIPLIGIPLCVVVLVWGWIQFNVGGRL